MKGESCVPTHLASRRQLLLALAEWLCDHRETDERARNIVEGMHLFLLPTMNPDGFERHQRGNIKQACPPQLCFTCVISQCSISMLPDALCSHLQRQALTW